MHVRAILDEKGSIMVLAIHNCDNGDGWEREGEEDYFFQEFSEKRAYPRTTRVKTYEIRIGNEWYEVKVNVDTQGWLKWKDKDGGVGIKRPQTFREVVRKSGVRFSRGSDPRSSLMMSRKNALEGPVYADCVTGCQAIRVPAIAGFADNRGRHRPKACPG
ncbi:MAG TPA: hypothetical protein VK639_22675 [Terriglobales bacterium]|nr:hypothetical protein [Terriglobales bacterium]